MNGTRSFLLITLCAVLLLGMSRCAAVQPDPSQVFAMEANDATVMISGCGSQPVVGYTYCRVEEGQAGDLSLTLHAPPVKCRSRPCVSFRIFYPSGHPTEGVTVPDGQTAVTIPWKNLLQRDTFGVGDRGFWPVVMEWKWLDAQGNEHTSVAEGEIRLRVLSRGYEPLHEVTDHPAFAWRWTDSGHEFRLSTAGRASVGSR
jgi:hypothetical protein